MTKEFLEEQFKLFLKENNISFNYYKILNLNSWCHKQYTDLLNNTYYSTMIVGAFTWINTHEGFNYWQSIHYKWADVYKNILKGQKLYYNKDKILYND